MDNVIRVKTIRKDAERGKIGYGTTLDRCLWDLKQESDKKHGKLLYGEFNDIIIYSDMTIEGCVAKYFGNLTSEYADDVIRNYYCTDVFEVGRQTYITSYNVDLIKILISEFKRRVCTKNEFTGIIVLLRYMYYCDYDPHSDATYNSLQEVFLDVMGIGYVNPEYVDKWIRNIALTKYDMSRFKGINGLK